MHVIDIEKAERSILSVYVTNLPFRYYEHKYLKTLDQFRVGLKKHPIFWINERSEPEDKIILFYTHLESKDRELFLQSLKPLYLNLEIIEIDGPPLDQEYPEVRRGLKKILDTFSIEEIMSDSFIFYTADSFDLKSYSNILDSFYDIPLGTLPSYEFTPEVIQLFKDKNVPIYSF